MTAVRPLAADPAFRHCSVLLLVTLALHLVLIGAVELGGWQIGHRAPGFWQESDGYLALAESLRETGRFAFAPDAPPTAHRGPAYPAAVAIASVGTRGYAAAGLAVNVMAGLLHVLLVYAIVRRFYSHRAAFWFALIASLYPLQYYYVLSGFADRFLAMTFAAYVLAALWSFERRSIGAGIAAGVALAVCVLTKPVFWLLPLAALPVGLLWDRRWTRPLAVQLVTLLCVTLPWNVRVHRLTGEPAMVAHGGGFVLFAGNFMADHRGDGDAVFYAALSDIFEYMEREHGQAFGQAQLRDGPHFSVPAATDKLFAQAALAQFARDPLLLPRKVGINLARFWYFAASREKSVVVGLINLPIAVLGFVQLARLRRRRRREVLWLATAIVYTWFIYAAIIVHSRFYLPVVPLLAPFAVAFVAGVVRRTVRRTRGRGLPAQASGTVPAAAPFAGRPQGRRSLS